MSNVLQFKRNGKKPHHRDGDGKLPEVRTTDMVFYDVFDDIIGDWQRFAVRNRLNEYIISKLPFFLKGPPSTDYISDLNALSAIELKLDIKVALFWPGTTTANPIGWIAGFHKDGKIFTTPADMSSEGYARALNILLYMGLENQLRSLSGSLK